MFYCILYELGKSDKMRGLLNVRFYLSQDIKMTLNGIFGVKTTKFCHILHSVIRDVIYVILLNL